MYRFPPSQGFNSGLGALYPMCILVLVWGLCFSSIAAGTTWSHKGLMNVWVTDNCQRTKGWIKTEHRTKRISTCWHVLLSAFQGGFSLFETQLLNGTDYSWDGGWNPTVLLGTWHQLYSQGERGCCGSWGGSGVSESSVLNQTNTLEFLPLLVQTAEWQGCIAELPVSRKDSRSKYDLHLSHCSILTLKNLFIRG